MASPVCQCGIVLSGLLVEAYLASVFPYLSHRSLWPSGKRFWGLNPVIDFWTELNQLHAESLLYVTSAD